MPKIVVKVGTKSTLKFRDSELFRAITIEELKNLSNGLSDTDIIIIEHLYEFEYTKACGLIRDLTSNQGKKVFFYLPDNDENTSGVADELDLDIYMTADALYRAIEVSCGVNVNPDLSLRVGTVSIDFSLNDGFDESFAESIENLGKLNIADVDTLKEYPEISSKRDIREDFENSDFEELPTPVNTPQPQGQGQGDTSENQQADHVKQGDQEISDTDNSEFNSNISTSVETPDISVAVDPFDPVDQVGVDITNETTDSDNTDSTDETENIEPQESEDTDKSDNSDTSKSDIDIEKLQSDLQDANASIGILEKQVKETTDKVIELNKVIKSIKDERDLYKSELEALENSEIIEDPETMLEFNSLKEKVNELNEKLLDSANITNNELEQIKIEKSSLEESITILTADKQSAENKIAELELKIAELEQSLSDASNDDKINELSGQIVELNKILDDTITQLEAKAIEIETKNSQINDLSDREKSEYESKIILVEMLKNAVIQLVEIDTLRNSIIQLNEEKTRLTSQISQLMASEADKDTKLSKMKQEADTRVELARNFASEELSNLKNENVALRAQFNMIQGQLTAKTAQYDELVRATGFDISGALSIVDNNKTLEAMNSTLRNQLADLKIAYEKENRERVEISRLMDSLKDQNSQLTTQIRALSAGYSGGAGTGMMLPINYSGRAQVISVFGSGSFGVTTSAITTALNLCSNARVLFIDFDMMSAKADRWFQTNPMFKGIAGTNPNSGKNTALGLLVDRGVQFFLTYVAGLLPRPVNTKGGYITYMSGLYEKPDVVKLVATDFTGLMNFAGNSYDYVVIDFGKIGASEINDQIIKIFCDISRAIMIVTSSDRADIRNMKINIQKNRIDMNKAGWLINLADSTKLDEKAKAYISPAGYLQMPIISDFYGQLKDFSKVRMSKDRFNEFLDRAVLKR